MLGVVHKRFLELYIEISYKLNFLKFAKISITNKKNMRGNILKKFLGVIIFYFISLVAVSNLLWYFIPPEDFFNYIQNPGEHLLLLGILFCASLLFTLDITYLQEKILCLCLSLCKNTICNVRS